MSLIKNQWIIVSPIGTFWLRAEKTEAQAVTDSLNAVLCSYKPHDLFHNAAYIMANPNLFTKDIPG